MKKKWKCVLPGRDGCRFMLPRYVAMLLFTLSVLTLSSCKDDEQVGEYNPDASVSIKAIMPTTGGIQTPIVIEGRNFGTDKKKVEVFFNNRKALVVNVKNDYIYALVPKCEGGDNEVKVVIDGKSEGVLKDMKFDYIVSSKVTTIASEFYTQLANLQAIAVDEEDNLVICEYGAIKLYSIKDNVLTTVLKLDNTWNFIDACFSKDGEKCYILPSNLRKAVVVALDKTNNWNREMIFDSEGVTQDVSYPIALTVADDGYIYVLGEMKSGTAILKVNPSTRKITQYGTVSNEDFERMAYNPKDKYIYLTHRKSCQIYRFTTQKETLTDADVELVTGKIETPPKEVDGSFEEARFFYPMGIECDADGILYVNDNYGHTIRKIDVEKKMVTTLAGKAMIEGYVDGSAENARFAYPLDVAVTATGIVYVMEYRTSGTKVLRLRCVAVQ